MPACTVAVTVACIAGHHVAVGVFHINRRLGGEGPRPRVTLADGSVFITSLLADPGLTVVMVVVPTMTQPQVAVIVLPLPAAVGVKVGKVVNTPAVNAAEVPVAPAVPPKVTVPVNALGPLLQTLP